MGRKIRAINDSFIQLVTTMSSSRNGQQYFPFLDNLERNVLTLKDIDAVMNAQTELVEVVYTLRQVVCVKG